MESDADYIDTKEGARGLQCFDYLLHTQEKR